MSAFKTVPLLMKQMKSQLEAKNFSCAAKAAFVSLRLAEAEGRKGVAARGEGRISEKQQD